jgi:hypothetical protein
MKRGTLGKRRLKPACENKGVTSSFLSAPIKTGKK